MGSGSQLFIKSHGANACVPTATSNRLIAIYPVCHSMWLETRAYREERELCEQKLLVKAIAVRQHEVDVRESSCSLSIWISVNRRSRCKRAWCWPKLLCLRRAVKDAALRPVRAENQI